MEREPGTWPDVHIYYVPHDTPPVCGYRVSWDVGDICGKPAEYEFRLQGDDARGGACAEHAQLVRTHPRLDRMWSL